MRLGSLLCGATVAALVLAVGPASARLAGAAGPAPAPGTRHADVIDGTARADVLRGKGGNDRIYGRGGNDTLVGGHGRDLLVGGAGNDTVEARDGQRDAIFCGAGDDTVRADAKDVVSPTCEHVSPKATAAGPGALDIQVSSVNNGGGHVEVLLDLPRPARLLNPCGALECLYTDWPNPGIPTLVLAIKNDIASDGAWGGDCAGNATGTCRITMDTDKVVTVKFTGSG